MRRAHAERLAHRQHALQQLQQALPEAESQAGSREREQRKGLVKDATHPAPAGAPQLVVPGNSFLAGLQTPACRHLQRRQSAGSCQAGVCNDRLFTRALWSASALSREQAVLIAVSGNRNGKTLQFISAAAVVGNSAHQEGPRSVKRSLKC